MITQHTPGRLKIGEKQRDVFAFRAEIDECPVGGAFSPADARRLVACWNALDGIPTTELESAAQSGSISYAQAKVIGQRDELLVALRTARDHIDMDALEISHCKDAECIRAAIAKVES